MARIKSKNVRRIESVEKVDSKNAVDTQKSAKPKSKKVTSFGSGEGETQASGKNYQRRKKIPEIQNVEKTVLQSIIGQDNQVRQIITAIYRAINFKSIKSNVLIIGIAVLEKLKQLNKSQKGFIFRIPLKMLLSILKKDIMEQTLMT